MTDDPKDGVTAPLSPTLTFSAFRQANVARCLKWHPQGIASWSPADWLTAVTGELGELASLLKMRNRERDGLVGNKFSPSQKQIADELADVVTYLDLLAEALGVDLGAAAIQKFNEVSERNGFPDRIEPDADRDRLAAALREREAEIRAARNYIFGRDRVVAHYEDGTPRNLTGLIAHLEDVVKGDALREREAECERLREELAYEKGRADANDEGIGLWLDAQEGKAMPNTDPITPETREADAQWATELATADIIRLINAEYPAPNSLRGWLTTECERLKRLAALSRGVVELEQRLQTLVAYSRREEHQSDIDRTLYAFDQLASAVSKYVEGGDG